MAASDRLSELDSVANSKPSALDRLKCPVAAVYAKKQTNLFCIALFQRGSCYFRIALNLDLFGKVELADQSSHSLYVSYAMLYVLYVHHGVVTLICLRNNRWLSWE